MKPESRKPADLVGDDLASALAAGLHPVELGQRQRSELRERILGRIRDPAPDGTSTLRATEPGWHSLNERVQIRILRRDQIGMNQTMLIRMLPGGVIDAHVHSQEEECYVIDGEIEIGDHPVRCGDMHVASRGAAHPRILSRCGALLLVRTEIPAGSVTAP
jgi:mannose-6-phosphate isomerase-like protein (cupin superfamily)